MKNYTELNSQMETLACVVRQLYLFEDKHNSDDEIKFICDFVEYMRTLEKIEDINDKYKIFLNQYLKRIGNNAKVIAPDVF